MCVFQEMQDTVVSPEKAEEAKLKARYPHLGAKPGGSDLLRKRLQKGVSGLTAYLLDLGPVDGDVSLQALFPTGHTQTDRKTQFYCPIGNSGVLKLLQYGIHMVYIHCNKYSWQLDFCLQLENIAPLIQKV